MNSLQTHLGAMVRVKRVKITESRTGLRQSLRRNLALAACTACLLTAPSATAAQVLYSHGDPTPEEQLMLELVNRARANPSAEAARFGIDLNEGITNALISTDPKQPLAFNSHIIAAARGHSQWMLDNSIFAHIETDGSSPGDRMTAAGYVFSGSWTYGENITFRGTTGPPPPVGPTVVDEHQDLFVDATEPGRGHRINLMDGAFREIGIGAKSGVFTDETGAYNSVMVTQDFGATGGNPGPFLLGVVYQDANSDGNYDVGEGLAGMTITPAGGSSYAVSSTSGGYAIPVTGLSGTVQVTFSGGPLASPITKSVTVGSQNVKLDFELNADSVPAPAFVGGSAKFAGGHFNADLHGAPNTRMSVQASDDLKNWSEIQQVALDATGAGHVTDNSPSPARRFYRALKL
jgi:uncharacterized protein YkwD